MNVTVVSTGTGIHVHAAGCADLLRSPKYRRLQDNMWDVPDATMKSVVLDVYSCHIEENPGSTWEDYASDFKVFPCAGDLA
jgi:hypothetical protein